MMRKLLVGGAMAALVVLAAQVGEVGGQEKKQGKGAGKAPYIHTVIFYLKKGTPKESISDLISDSHTMLAKIPSVKGVWAGRPAEKSTPKFAATDYDVGLLVLFENYEGLQEYIDHKLHTEFVEKHAKNFERVTVFDFLNQKK